MTSMTPRRGRSGVRCPHLDRDRVCFHDGSEHCLFCGEIVGVDARRSAGRRLVGFASALAEVVAALAVLAVGGLVLLHLLVRTTAIMIGSWSSGLA